MRLHDPREADNRSAIHQAVGVEGQHEFVLTAPSIAKIPDIAGLVA